MMSCFSAIARFVALSLMTTQCVSGQSRYFVGYFDGELNAYPIDICVQQTALLPSTSYIYSCSQDGSSINETTYSDSNCGTESGTTTYDSSTEEFECDGDDNYVGLSFYQNDCISPVSTLYSVVDLCFQSDTSTYSQSTCSDSAVSISTYTDSACASTPTTTDINGCTFYRTFYFTIDVYYAVTECIISSQTTTTTNTPQIDTTTTNTVGGTRYFVGLFAGEVTAFPIDICVTTSVSPATSSIYSCSSDGLLVTEITYSGYNCGTETGNNSFDLSSEDFECNGDDNYAELGLYLDDASCSGTPPLILYHALNVCVSSTTTQTTCSGSTVSISFYDDTICTLLRFSIDINSTCAFYDSISGFTVYSNVNDCVMSDGSPSATIAITTEVPTIVTTKTMGIVSTTKLGTMTTTQTATSQITDGIISNSRYFIGDFESSPYPYPIDICVETGIFADRAIYTCSLNGSMVTENIYSSSDIECAGSISATNIYNSSDAEFNCDGFDNYVSLDLYLQDSSCGSSVATLYGAIGLCVQVDIDSYFTMTCDDTLATVSTFSDSNCTVLAVDGTTDINGCTLWGTYDYNIAVVNVYYQIDECVIDDDTNSETETPITTDITINENTNAGTSSESEIIINTNVRYFVEDFEGVPYPFPIDICVETGVLFAEHAMYSCSQDKLTVTENIYSTSDSVCSGSIRESTTYNSSNAEFSCNGVDSYGSINIYLSDSTCGDPTATIYSAIGLCIQSDTDQYLSVTCDDTSVTIYTFTDGNCTNLAVDGVVEVNGCTFATTYSGFDVYYQLDECNIADIVTTTPATTVVTTTPAITVVTTTPETTVVTNSNINTLGQGGSGKVEDDDNKYPWGDNWWIPITIGVIIVIIILFIFIYVIVRQKKSQTEIETAHSDAMSPNASKHGTMELEPDHKNSKDDQIVYDNATVDKKRETQIV